MFVAVSLLCLACAGTVRANILFKHSWVSSNAIQWHTVVFHIMTEQRVYNIVWSESGELQCQVAESRVGAEVLPGGVFIVLDIGEKSPANMLSGYVLDSKNNDTLTFRPVRNFQEESLVLTKWEYEKRASVLTGLPPQHWVKTQNPDWPRRIGHCPDGSYVPFHPWDQELITIFTEARKRQGPLSDEELSELFNTTFDDIRCNGSNIVVRDYPTSQNGNRLIIAPFLPEFFGATATIHDAQNNLVWEGKVQADTQIEFNARPPGTYFLKGIGRSYAFNIVR